MIFIKLFNLLILYFATNNESNKNFRLRNFPSNNSSSIYVFCRGTDSKAALIGNKLNLNDCEITHCGIGFYNGSTFEIFNVIDKPKNDSNALIIDNYYSFTNVSGLKYLSIWENKIDNFDFIKIKDICEK